jgi:hypothetical protein
MWIKGCKANIAIVLVLHGDESAFYQPQILKKLIDSCKERNLDMIFYL